MRNAVRSGRRFSFRIGNRWASLVSAGYDAGASWYDKEKPGYGVVSDAAAYAHPCHCKEDAMSEMGKLINEAIDKAQEFAGEMKAAGDKVIDAVQEQAPVVMESAKAKTEELLDQAQKNFPEVMDDAKAAAEKAMDATKSAAEKVMDVTSSVAEKTVDATKEMADRAADATKATVDRITKKEDEQ